MRSKILLIGKKGQLGYELLALLAPQSDLIAVDRQQLDLAQAPAIRRIIREHRPQIIINAAAYTAVDAAEKDEASAQAVNADAPEIMAQEAKQIGATIVHYSTDYIFDGTKNSPYLESDSTNPISAYGRTKLAGEEAIRSTSASHLIFRTAWVYGIRGRNFLLTMLRLATQRDELRVVHDQIGAPTSSQQIASATVAIIRKLIRERGAFDAEGVTGTYHLTAGGQTNWAEFASRILDYAKANQQLLISAAWFSTATNGLPIIAKQVTPITSAEYPTPARRPSYSVLSNAKLNRTFGIQLQDWRSQLEKIFRG